MQQQAIKQSRTDRSRMLLLTLLALWCVQSVAIGQEYAEQLRKPFWMQGKQIRKAFSKVIQDQREWSVTLFSEDKPVALGTIVASDGWIVTKASQIAQATLCEFADGRRLPFEYVGLEAKLDLALIKVDTNDLQSVEWATAADPLIGSWMISVGPQKIPLGVGVMSVPRRKIPRSDVRGVLGIQLQMIDAAVIERVFPKSGAANGGLLAGDKIVTINQTSIRGRIHLIETIAEYRPGDSVVAKILRDGEELSLTVTLTHPFGDFLSRIAFQEQMGGPLSFRRDDFEAVYQHDTVILPEDCGGPVVNLEGKAVGINIARAGRTATYVLPADLILEHIDELKSGTLTPPMASNNGDAEQSAAASEE